MAKNIEKKENIQQVMSTGDFVRIAHNFYNQKGITADISRFDSDINLFNYINANAGKLEKKKVAMVFICLNPLYWQFAPEMVRGMKQYFLPGHDVDHLFWTDIPEKEEDIANGIKSIFKERGVDTDNPALVTNNIQINNTILNIQNMINDVVSLKSIQGVSIFPTDPQPWPMPTLMRYHLFLQQEEKLKEYDYVFYCDVDMKFVNVIGDEILGEGLTAAPHPGYYVRKEYIPPYEPNPESASYIPRPGRLINDNGKPRFMPFYAAGGFQGGKTESFIKAMKKMRDLIDDDFVKNYIPIWNDETVWNKYLFDNPASVYLDPSYVYPDSLIKEYYEKLWGRNFVPKLITITKWFSLNQQGGEDLQKFLATN